MSEIVYISAGDPPEMWRQALVPALPEADLEKHFHVWPDGMDGLQNFADVDIALVWRPPPGVLNKFPNLKAIINLGAGVDHIVADNDWPRRVPLVRLVDPAMTRHMTEFVIHRVLHFHRKFHLYDDLQRRHIWRALPQADTLQRRVGILGLGELGGDAAARLSGLGFRVAGWSRTEKQLPGMQSFFGDSQLPAFLGRSEILVCLLPLTAATKGLLNAANLARLPAGAFLINVARGGLVIEADLLAALDSGQIEAAALDVFETEPLPENSPFWDHPGVLLSPHMASLSAPSSAATVVAENIRRVRRGEAPENVVDLSAGY